MTHVLTKRPLDLTFFHYNTRLRHATLIHRLAQKTCSKYSLMLAIFQNLAAELKKRLLQALTCTCAL